jgi:hypothetical protein
MWALGLLAGWKTENAALKGEVSKLRAGNRKRRAVAS